ncbi:MAG: serpin family protein [Bradymonadaceae bacterium]
MTSFRISTVTALALVVLVLGTTTGCETPDESEDDSPSVEKTEGEMSGESSDDEQSTHGKSEGVEDQSPGDSPGTATMKETDESSRRISDPDASKTDISSLTDGQSAFAFDLYGRLKQKKSGENLFYSPYSLSTVLAMVRAGAAGTTESQLNEAVHLSLPEEKLHPAFNAVAQSLERRAEETGDRRGTPFRLRLADAVWGQSGFSIKEPYLDTLAQHYGAGLKTLDFQKRPESARKTINRWVAQQTEGKIEELLPKGSVDPRTRLLLTDAIYFKATWAETFDEKKTSPGTFTTLDGESVETPMMHGELRDTAYAEGQHWMAIEMPYVGGDVSMVAIVPNEGSFSTIEGKLSPDWLSTVLDKLHPQALELTFPKFEFESSFSAKSLLQKLGAKAPFDPEKADFSGISDRADLHLTDVVHKARISVDEQGTEAAAASGATMGVTSLPQYQDVAVDRPFIFVIRDRETGAPLFVGRVVDPS